jgi:hypothetical protein
MTSTSIRAATDNDIPYIFSSWLKSYKATLPNVPTNIYYTQQHKVIEDILAKSQTIILCSSEDPDQIFSYVVFEATTEQTTIHWLNTKYSFRRLGFATQLLQLLPTDTPSFYSHQSRLSTLLADKHNLSYNPFQESNKQ